MICHRKLDMTVWNFLHQFHSRQRSLILFQFCLTRRVLWWRKVSNCMEYNVRNHILSISSFQLLRCTLHLPTIDHPSRSKRWDWVSWDQMFRWNHRKHLWAVQIHLLLWLERFQRLRHMCYSDYQCRRHHYRSSRRKKLTLVRSLFID